MSKTKNQEWRDCSEAELKKKVAQWTQEQGTLLLNAIVFLDGEMGAGKSTFARAMIEILCPGARSKGSPTFPIVQEYRAPGVLIFHIDLYRLERASELEDSGILSQVETPNSLALVEWSSRFDDELGYWKKSSNKMRSKEVWVVTLQPGERSDQRSVKIEKR